MESVILYDAIVYDGQGGKKYSKNGTVVSVLNATQKLKRIINIACDGTAIV